jgi:ADP-ribose pyrophosphatase YjhB (NUDIX family)
MTDARSQITRIGAYGIVRDNAYILLCRLSAEAVSHQGMWTLPGGGLEFGEHPEQGLVREIMEETGFEVRAENLVGINSITRDDPIKAFQSIQIIYHAQITGGTLRFEEQGTTDMCEWHALDGVADLQVVGLVRAALSMLSL